jgi:glycosyltransferase involved in cell wall biosynthesis
MTGKPRKLVILLQDLEFGGTQRYAINLLQHLDRRLFSPELWVMRGGLDMAPMAQETGVNVVHLSASNRVGPGSLARLLRRLIHCRPEILYTLTVVPNIWGRILGRLVRIPVIVAGYRSLLPRQHERWLWPLSHRIICNARALEEIMVDRFHVESRRIAVIPNGVDTDHFSPAMGARAPEPTVLCVGRLVADKDPLGLLLGLRQAALEVPRARFEIIGNGPLRGRLEAAIREASLESRISLIPPVQDIRPYLNRAWVLALASIREASPNVILEAMASGLPVVATHVGGIPEVVANGQTGFLVEPGDHRGFADALVTILREDSRRRAMGKSARETVCARFPVCRMIRQTERVFTAAVCEMEASQSALSTGR